jgi:hypothetical protein
MNDKPTGAAAAFDVTTWQEELGRLNQWARGFTIDENDRAFEAERERATLERYARGGQEWNAWAEGMLALKTALEKAGWWKWYKLNGEHGYDETNLWRELSQAVFSSARTNHVFGDEDSFRQLIFPGRAEFERATFPRNAQFERTTFFGSASFGSATFSYGANFNGATFSEQAYFSGAIFSSRALFNKVTFSGDAVFRQATFSEEAWFKGATFLRDVKFEGLTFPDNVWFEDAIFRGSASFEGVTFSRNTTFRRATFSGDALFGRASSGDHLVGQTTFSGNAWFERASFSTKALFEGVIFSAAASLDRVRYLGPATFSRAKFFGATVLDESEFKGSANFDGLESTGTFSLASAKFRQVPSILGAAFRGLRLDNVQTPRFRWQLGWARDKDAPARFRELKRRANEAQDRDREIEFFAQEIRTSRFHAKGLPAYLPRVWEWRFWFGLLFGTFSDFGRSLWRPVLFWFILLVGCFAFYLGEHEDVKKERAVLNPDGMWSTASAYVQTTFSAYSNPPPCRPREKETFASTDAWAEAVNLALANALVVDTGRGTSSRRTYGCLYGFETAGDQEYAKVSSRVSRVSTFQSLASGVLLLLFLLAVRNLLRLK